MPTRNKSSVRYNFITLQYEDSYEGESLKYKDDIGKRNAALRAGKINHMRMAESRTDYDVITGLPKPKTRVPVPELGPAPVAPEKVERETERIRGEMLQLFNQHRESTSQEVRADRLAVGWERGANSTARG